MRSTLPLLAALALALPLAAHADSFDTFTLTGAGATVTWSESATVTTPDYSLWTSISEGVTATIDGTPGYSVSATYYSSFYPFLSTYIVFPLGSPGGLTTLPLSGPDVFTWTTIPASNPPPYLPEDIVATFTPGTYSLHTATGTAFSLDIEPEVAVIPEPASIALLATGMIAALGAMRLRRRPAGPDQASLC